MSVREFHEAFGLPISDVPVVPVRSDSFLRWGLINEEATEVSTALADLERYRRDCQNGDEELNQEWVVELLTNIAKELADLMVVVEGTALTYGLPLAAAHAAVCESNMSKLGADGKPIVREDGKVLKGPNYVPAEPAIRRLIEHARCGTEECCKQCV